MSIVIDLSDLQGCDIASDFDAAESDRFTVTRNNEFSHRLQSLTTESTFLYFRIPGKLPVGALVEGVMESKSVSGSRVQIGFDSYNNQSYGGTEGTGAGKILEDNCDGTDKDEYIESRSSFYVRPGNQYARMVVGYFGSRIGADDIRALRVCIDGGDIVNLRPELSPRTSDQYYNIGKLNRQWDNVQDGTGSITRGASFITMAANAASRSYVRLSASNTSTEKDIQALYNIEGSKGFSVEVKHTRRSGLPGIYIDYIDGGGTTIDTLRGFLTGGTEETQKFWFPPYPGADRAHIAIGFFTDNDGDFDLYSARVIQYDAPEPDHVLASQPIAATLQKIGGVWTIDNDSITEGNLRIGSSRVASVSSDSTKVTVTFDANSVSGRPVCIPSMDNFNSGSSSYYCAAGSTEHNKTDITFYDRSTDVLIDPGTIPNDTYLSIVGFGIR